MKSINQLAIRILANRLLSSNVYNTGNNSEKIEREPKQPAVHCCLPLAHVQDAKNQSHWMELDGTMGTSIDSMVLDDLDP